MAEVVDYVIISIRQNYKLNHYTRSDILKFKFKTLLFSIIFIFLLSGILHFSKNTFNEKSNNEVTQSVSATEVTDKDDKDKAVSEISAVSSESDKEQQAETKEAIKKVVVIDPGHGSKANLDKEPIYPGAEELKIKDGGGAEGINSKTPEYVVAYGIAEKLKELLENNGYTVVMTKNTAAENLGNIERAEIGNENNANLVIRIHADSADSSSAAGASMLVPANVGYSQDISEISGKYGQVVLQSLIDEVGMKNRGVVKRDDLTGFNWSKVPVILVEAGFLSNPNEDELLNSEEYQSKIAKGLFDGIDKALNN